MTRSLAWSSSSSRERAALWFWRCAVVAPGPSRFAAVRDEVKDCLDVLGPGAGAASPSCTSSPSVWRDSALVCSSTGLLVPVSPASDAFAEVACRREGRLDNPEATVLWDPGLEVLVVVPATEGREVREAAD